MPSGAKKRKAAKKKKENSILLHSHGEEDLEHQNEKDSDGGDVGSPASQDNHNCHELMDQEVEKQSDGSGDQSSVREHKSDEMTNGGGEEVEKGTMEEESALIVQREFKVEDEHDSKNISTEYIEAPKESHEGSLSRSSSSSSNSEDGSTAVDKNKIAVDETPGDLVKQIDSLSTGEVKDEGVVKVKVCDFDESGLMENGDKKTGIVDESASVSEGLVKMELGKDDEAVKTSHDNDAEASDATDFATQENGENVTVSHDVPKVHSIGDEELGKKEDESVQTSHENDAEALDTTDFATQENEENVNLSHDVPKVPSSIEDEGLGKKEDDSVQTSHENDAETLDANRENVTLSHDVPEVHSSIGDEGLGKKEDEFVQISRDNDVKTSETKDYATQEEGETLTLSYNAPKIDDPVKDSELSESSYNQHRVGSALRPVQTTSWKGCCGLFELFTGSNR